MALIWNIRLWRIQYYNSSVHWQSQIDLPSAFPHSHYKSCSDELILFPPCTRVLQLLHFYTLIHFWRRYLPECAHCCFQNLTIFKYIIINRHLNMVSPPDTWIWDDCPWLSTLIFFLPKKRCSPNIANVQCPNWRTLPCTQHWSSPSQYLNMSRCSAAVLQCCTMPDLQINWPANFLVPDKSIRDYIFFHQLFSRRLTVPFHFRNNETINYYGQDTGSSESAAYSEFLLPLL